MPTQRHVVILSGAGMSAESGIKTFRDSGGLWEGHDVMEVASPEGWSKDQDMVLDFYNQRRKNVLDSEPNEGHLALARLEEEYKVTIVTQNIDDLHERAGSTNIVHLHGEILKSRSTVDPTLIYECRDDIVTGDTCAHGSQLRPHIVWFGEDVPLIGPAAEICSAADIVIVVGTSMVVYPAAGLINYARADAKKFLVDPNAPEVPRIPDLIVINDTAAKGLPALIEQYL